MIWTFNQFSMSVQMRNISDKNYNFPKKFSQNFSSDIIPPVELLI
jgi:hypothetical protein